MPLIRRKRKKRFLESQRFFRMFRRNTMAVVSQGNRVELFEHGAAYLSALLHGCDEAGEFIHLEFYIVRDDEIGRALADRLLGAVTRGVEVSLIYDYIGCFDTPSSYFRRLEEGGVRTLPFNPPPFRQGMSWFDKRNHRKMAVIDGKCAFTGGTNIGKEYFGTGEELGRWRDLGIRIDGPAAAEMERLFRNNWVAENGSSGVPWKEQLPLPVATGDAELMIVSGGPHHNRSRIRSAFRLAIAGASESIMIMNPYFVPGPRVVRSLLRAIARGVSVQLILPAKSDAPIVRLVGRSYYTPLLKAGIEIYEREGTVLHAKVMLIDDAWAVIGSANLDQRSFHRNHEVNVIVNSREFGSQVNRMFAEDLKRSRRIVIEDHERRGLLTRLLERLCAPISWFL
jgi:cardiolipin synthase